MQDALLIERQCASQRAFYEHVMAGGAQSWIEQPVEGVLATVCPTAPLRSVPNSVLYVDPVATAGALDALAALYAAAGVRAWTVWVQSGHAALADVLEGAGHAHDGWPLRMGARLADVDLGGPPPPREFDLDDHASFADVGRLNDRAYGLEGEIERLFADVRDPATHLWLARSEGEPVAGVLIRELDGDAYVGMVATVPAVRRRGVAWALMRRGLAASAARGCETTTLEASAMGEPLYARMGYRPLGRFGLWERRARAGAA